MDKTLKEELIIFGIPEDEIKNYCSDLYVLETHNSKEFFDKYPQKNINRVRSDVKGQSWYGKMFYDIPFAYYEYYEKKVRQL